MGTVCIKQQESVEFDEEDYSYGQLIRKSNFKESLAMNQCTGIYRQREEYQSKLPHNLQPLQNKTSASKNILRQFPEMAARYKQVVCGNFDIDLHSKAKIVRIFISSTFTDTAVERNALMVKVFPELKIFCQEKGYEFQVVDMRWGVREQSADDHTTLDLCLKEIKACQQISTGPNFVTFLGQKYGFRPFPRRIPKTEFEKIFCSIKNESDGALVQRWFQCDYNAVPPAYLLQSISSYLPGYRSSDMNERNKACVEWQEVFKMLQSVLRHAAVQSLQDKEHIHKYFMSVTESEIRSGILSSSDPSCECCWFRRKIENLEDHLTEERTHYYIDVQQESKIDEEAQALLESLKKDIVLRNLSDSNIRQYQVEWGRQGIDPEHLENHKMYIEQICHDVRTVLEKLIESALLERTARELSDSVFDEASQHLLFCKSKCETFYGREDVLKQCKNYLAGSYRSQENLLSSPNSAENLAENKFSNGWLKEKDFGNIQEVNSNAQDVQMHKQLAKNLSTLSNEQDLGNHPLVVYGKSGCGKTSVVSMVAMKSREWFGGNVKVIVRYIGTTPDSSLVRLLLKSVCLQICVIYDEDDSFIGNDIKSLKKDFFKCLQMATANEPLFIVLDSLDQFGPEDSARQLSWLPMTLPDHVKLVVSTIPGEEYECLPVLEAFLPKDCFVEVPKLPEDDAANILFKWLSMENRTLTSKQQDIIKEALKICSLPIFVRVTFDEAVRWKSYSPSDQTRLEHTVRGAINALFSRIEKQHGHVLVRHALGYVTAAKSGLTETELEDVLSCDDEVLDDVYQFWTPPIRRIPPLLWVRVRADLGGYLVDRGADGASVITWYHRQFIEAARTRYLGNKEEILKIHKSLSELFLGQWSNGIPKPYTTRDGVQSFADRLVARQPLTFQASSNKIAFNYRKLKELPYHLTCAQMNGTLKSEVICNFEFLLVNLLSSSLRDVLDDYDFALQYWPTDNDIRLVKETLQLSTYALAEYPQQLPCQLLGRIKKAGSNFLRGLLQQARTSSHSNLIPSAVCLASPGGPMVHSLSGQSLPSTALNVSDDGKLVVSASADMSCSIWEVSSGRLVRTIENAGENISSLNISADNSFVVASSQGCLSAWRISTGQRLFFLEGFDSPIPVCFVGHKDVIAIAAIINNSIKIYNLKTKKQIREIFDIKLQNCSPEDVCRSSLFSFQDSLYYIVKNDPQGSGSSVRGLDLGTGAIRDVIYLKDGAKDIRLVGVSAYGTFVISQEQQPMDVQSSSASVNPKSSVIELWDSSLNKRLRYLNDPDDDMRCYTMSSDKTSVAILYGVRFLNTANEFQGFIKIFDLQTDDVKQCTLRFPSSIHLISYVNFNQFISSSRDKLIRVWDFTRNQLSDESQEDELEIVDSYGDKAVFIQVDKVGFVDIRSGNTGLFTDGCAPQLDFLTETKVVITNGEDMFLFDVTNKKPILKLQGKTRSNYNRNLFIFNQTEVIAISSDSKSLNIYDVSSGNKIAQLKTDEGHLISRFASTSDGRFCVVAHRETTKGELAYGYTVWDVEKRRQIGYLQGMQHALAEFSDLDISNDKTFVLDIIFDAISSHYQAVVYDVTSGRLLHQPEDNVHCAAFVSMGKQFLLGTINGSLRLYDCVSGQCIHSMRAHSSTIHRIFTNDYSDVVMTTAGGLDSKDRSLKIWRIEGDKFVLHTVFTPDAKISSMAFAAKGQAIVLEITDIVPFWLISDNERKKTNQDDEQPLKCSFTVSLSDFSKNKIKSTMHVDVQRG